MHATRFHHPIQMFSTHTPPPENWAHFSPLSSVMKGGWALLYSWAHLLLCSCRLSPLKCNIYSPKNTQKGSQNVKVMFENETALFTLFTFAFPLGPPSSKPHFKAVSCVFSSKTYIRTPTTANEWSLFPCWGSHRTTVFTGQIYRTEPHTVADQIRSGRDMYILRMYMLILIFARWRYDPVYAWPGYGPAPRMVPRSGSQILNFGWGWSGLCHHFRAGSITTKPLSGLPLSAALIIDVLQKQ